MLTIFYILVIMKKTVEDICEIILINPVEHFSLKLKKLSWENSKTWFDC